MEVQSHSYKPKLRFFGKDDYHLGIELEVEAPSQEAMRTGLNIHRNPAYCYAKHDGSLSSTGWELVTQPIARKLWLKPGGNNASKALFRLTNHLRALGYTSHQNKRCGLHIHVSLTAFGVKDTLHRARKAPQSLYWFQRLINSELFRVLSQRGDEELNQWANQRQITTGNFFVRDGGRYTAGNMTEYTCEVRLFRGNLREDRIRKAVESVIAAVEFAKTLRSSDYLEFRSNRSGLSERMIGYILANKSLYPNLVSFMDEMEIVEGGIS